MTSILSATSSLRIGGLASGIDTDSIIKELMKAQRIPLDRLNQDKQILLWQQEDYRSLYDSLRTFRDKVFNMKLQATYQARKAFSSNEAAVSASANTSAVPGMYKIVVNQLAEGASATSSVKLVQSSDSSKTVDPTKPLNTQLTGLDPTYTFTINGSEQITVNTATDSLNSVIAKINGAIRPDGSTLGVKASYDQNLGRVFLVTTGTGADKK
ncbi:MAG: flagellar filament capping protein FliD, partial [Desulfofundulus sp.]